MNPKIRPPTTIRMEVFGALVDTDEPLTEKTLVAYVKKNMGAAAKDVRSTLRDMVQDNEITETRPYVYRIVQKV